LQMGYKGPLMFEPFEALSMEKGDPDVPEIYARGCARSLELLNRDVSTL
jgi:predicted xylose isomerase-like sugar epimerase